MKTIMKTLVFVALVGIVFYGFDTLAAPVGDVNKGWQNAFDVLVKTFKNVRTLVYVIGAFGLIGIAIGGIMGKIKWAWLGYLAAGLAIVAAADLIISYAVGSRNADRQAIQWEDNWAE